MWSKITWFVTGIFCLGAILRLARFNVENASGVESHQYFDGLPTPPAAGVLVSLALIYLLLPEKYQYAMFYPLVIGGPFLGLMMVSRIRYVHLVNKMLLGEHSFQYIALFAACVVGVVALGIYEYALAAAFIGYAFWGPLMVLLKRPRPEDETPGENVHT